MKKEGNPLGELHKPSKEKKAEIWHLNGQFSHPDPAILIFLQ